MPTYRNDTRSTVIVKNTNGADVPILPGGSVETYQQVQGFTETLSTPANEITVESDPGADAFTSPVKPNPEGYLNVSISGDGGIVITLQRSLDDGSTWRDMWNTSISGNEQEESLSDYSKSALYRIGVKYGGYSSGSVTARLSW